MEDAMTVNALLGYTLSVPDIEAGKRFYEDFGLVSHGRGDRLEFKVASGDSQPLTLIEGNGRRLHHLTFTVSPGAVKPLKERLQANGVALVDPPNTEPEALFAFRDPDHNLIVVRPGEKPDILGRRKVLAQQAG